MDNQFKDCTVCENTIPIETIGDLCKQCERVMEASKEEAQPVSASPTKNESQVVRTLNSCIACDGPTLNKEVCENCLLKLILKRCKTCSEPAEGKFAYCLKCITAHNAKKQACKNHTKGCPNFATPDKPYCKDCRTKYRASKQ